MAAPTIPQQIASLRLAISSGSLIVKHGDTSTTYRSLKEMKEILADLIGQQNSASGKNRARANYIVQKSKGFGC